MSGEAGNKRQLRNLRDWMELPDIDLDQFNAADLFAIHPIESEEEAQPTVEVKGKLRSF